MGWLHLSETLNFNFRERSSITSACLEGVGGLSQNADIADALEGGGRVDAKILTC